MHGGLTGVLCLAGATACGKTAAPLAIAQALANEQSARLVEIISVDSALVCRGMDAVAVAGRPCAAIH
jgi:tRNA A37 N6-isopentenylltransferase MiaA